MAAKSMPSWLSHTEELWSDWGLRAAVLSSVGAHVGLVILARSRRQYVTRGDFCASIWGAIFLWPAYQLADIAASYAISNLSLGGASSSSSCKQQLVAFWAPFLLLHLGGPDNISAYALEDNKLSLRAWIEVPLKAFGAGFVLYQYIFLGDSADLRVAAAIMFFVGAYKYVERAFTLWRSDLGNIKDTIKMEPRASGHAVSLTVGPGAQGNEEALLFAHSMFHFCRGAMVDDSSLVEEESSTTDSPPASERIFHLGSWMSTCKVVEMEISLMYDILYTKAALIHTLGGYFIRLVSPIATATAALLFWLFPKDCVKTVDIIITYILLVVAFLLDVVWLVRALCSTWTYAFLKARPRNWLHHELLCGGWWRWFRGIVLSLDPTTWFSGHDPASYRLWSGEIGRYNLLDKSTHPQGFLARQRIKVMEKLGLEHLRYMSPLSEGVKKLLFERIEKRLPTHDKPDPTDSSGPGDAYDMVDIITKWGQEAMKRRRKEFDARNQKEPRFGHEFQEDILCWHIGTCIFLTCADQQLMCQGECAKYAEAIEALSEYLMFLVAVRPHMLPGLVLRSLFLVTQDALREIFNKNKNYSNSRAKKEKLAHILREKKDANKDWGLGAPKTRLISDGALVALLLLDNVESWCMLSMLELIFDVWVDKLLYAGAQCSRESHAKQLSRGGELTTIVWIMTEHAGPFRIGKFAEKKESPSTLKKPEPRPAPEKDGGAPHPPPIYPELPMPGAPPPPPSLPPPPYLKPPKDRGEFATLYPTY